MKNILLLTAILLNNMAFGQNKPTSSFPEMSSFLSAPSKFYGFEPQQDPGLFLSPADQELDIHQNAGELLDLIQQYDSIYSWQWDSVTMDWQVKSKYIYTEYNSSHFPISFTRLIWNGSEWLNYLLYHYTYDENNNRTSTMTKFWNGTAWTNALQTLSTYYSNDSVITVGQQWNFNAWENTTKYFTAYDGSHNITKLIFHFWNQGWLPGDRITYTYDTLNNVTGYLSEDGQGMNWVNDSQNHYTYDSLNNLIYEIFQLWNGFSWDNDIRASYTYDSNNNEKEILTQTWNGGFWFNDGKQTNTFNTNHKITKSVYQYWTGFDWGNSTRDTSTYDGNLRIKYLLETWSGSNWLRSSIRFDTYDENSFYVGNSARNYDETGDVVVKGDSSHYYFQTITGTENLLADASNIIVYPNPSNGKFTVSRLSSSIVINIYDLNGKMVFVSRPVENQTSIEIYLLEFGKGVYIVNINDGIKVISRKVVVQ